MVQAAVENSRGAPQKLKHRINVESLNSTPGYTPKIFKSKDRNRYLYPIFIAALFTVAKRWKQLECPSEDEWINIM